MFFNINNYCQIRFVNQVLYLKGAQLQARKTTDDKTTVGTFLDCSGTELYLKIL